MPKKTIVAITPCAMIMEWYPAISLKRLPMPAMCELRIKNKEFYQNRQCSYLPLYRIVSKLTPIKLGSKKVSRPESQVPSPACRVFDEYVLLPAAARPEPDILRPILRIPRDLQSGMSELPKEICRDPPIRRMHHATAGSELRLEWRMASGPINCVLFSQ